MKQYRFGLVAKDIQNSVTPKVYRTYADELGLKISFEILNVPEHELSNTLDYCKENFDGFNITMPYKQTSLKHMDAFDESALECESTNTVLVKNGKLIAFNTDGWGLIRALAQRDTSVNNANVVLLGAGGVAYSIAYNLKINHVGRVSVINIYEDQTERLCEKFGPLFTPYALTYNNLAQYCEGADLFINASVMGQIGYDEFESFDFLEGLNPQATVYDVNYSNPHSLLVPAASQLGFKAYNGKSMTACQGIRAFEIWTGRSPSDRVAIDLVSSFESN